MATRLQEFDIAIVDKSGKANVELEFISRFTTSKEDGWLKEDETFDIFKACHDEQRGGHFTTKRKTIKILYASYYWSIICRDVARIQGYVIIFREWEDLLLVPIGAERGGVN